MSKKSSGKVVSQQVVQIVKRPVVERMSMDDLALLQDNELEGRLQFLRDEVNRKGLANLQGPEVQPYEVEVAYVVREQHIRQARRVKHRQYMSMLEQDVVDESMLPEFKATPPSWI